jgi:hypothetical protein
VASAAPFHSAFEASKPGAAKPHDHVEGRVKAK